MSKRMGFVIWSALVGIGLMLLVTACGDKGASSASPISDASNAAATGSMSGGPTLQAPTPATTSQPTPKLAVTAAETGAPTSAQSSASPVKTAPSAAPTATTAPTKAPEPSSTPAPTSKPTPTSTATPTPTPTPAPSPPPKADVEQIVNVEASYFVWKLDQTTVKSGTPVHFRVTSKEGLHGFSIEGTSVNVGIDEGKTEDVKWTPTKPGVYTIRCNQYCGTGHANMAVTITVT